MVTYARQHVAGIDLGDRTARPARTRRTGRADRTPAQATDVLQACRGRLEDLETVVGSRLTEGDLVKACRTLEDRGLVTGKRPERTSPVGKGRPAYELDVDVETVRTFVREDDRLSELPA